MMGKGVVLKFHSSTSAAIDHIKSFHDTTPSALTVNKTKWKVESEIKTQASRESKLFNDDPERFMKLTSVVDLIVAKFMPFSYFENDQIRHHYKLCALPEFPITGLNNKQVKHIIVERPSK